MLGSAHRGGCHHVLVPCMLLMPCSALPVPCACQLPWNLEEALQTRQKWTKCNFLVLTVQPAFAAHSNSDSSRSNSNSKPGRSENDTTGKTPREMGGARDPFSGVKC
ncbi:hypothetical protein V8C34DRAFT_281610 [Trichoderma compactum]